MRIGFFSLLCVLLISWFVFNIWGLGSDVVSLMNYNKWVLIELPSYHSDFNHRLGWEIDSSYHDDVLRFLYSCGNKTILLFTSGNYLSRSEFMDLIKLIKPSWVLVIPYPYNDTSVLNAVNNSLWILNYSNVSIWFAPSDLDNPSYIADYIVNHGCILHIDESYLNDSRSYLLDYPCGIEIYNFGSYGHFLAYKPKYVIIGGDDIRLLSERLHKCREYVDDVYIFSLYSRESLISYWDLTGHDFKHDCFGKCFYTLSPIERLVIDLVNDFHG